MSVITFIKYFTVIDPEKVALRVNMKNIPRDDSNPLPYQCPNCVHRYESVKDLNVHMINKHHKKILPTYKSNVKKYVLIPMLGEQNFYAFLLQKLNAF